MRISPDDLVLWHWGPITLNATIVFTWVVMAILAIGARLITARLSSGDHISRWQNLLEVLVIGMQEQIREVSRREPGRFLPFVGSLFLFIAASNLLAAVPGFEPPTGSLSTTTALALCVLIAVPVYGIVDSGLFKYLKKYLQPTVFMLPFNVIGELSRTLALAVRLYGNVMSGTIIASILISLTPLFFPVIMQAFGLLTGLVQAYIFAVLAMVFIASALGDDAAGRTGATTYGSSRRSADSVRRIKERQAMDNIGLIGTTSIIGAAFSVAVGSIGPALGEARAAAQALSSIAQQPDEAGTITRTLFVSLAMIESTAIYAFVVAMILIFANPFWEFVTSKAGG